MNRSLVLVVLVLLVLGALFFALRPAPQEAGAQERTVDLEIRGGTMTPDEVTLGEGDSVTLRITADHPTGFHLHGYDLEEEVSPGEPAELAFDADLTGRFDMEEERTQAGLGTLIVEPR